MNSENAELKKFSHDLGQNWYHIVLVPTHRRRIFQWEETKKIAEKAFDWVCSKHKIELFSKEVMDDHVHLFVSCPADYSIRKLFQVLKGGSSYYIRKNYPSLKKYKSLWTRGAMYRSVGSVNSETIKHYIESNPWRIK